MSNKKPLPRKVRQANKIAEKNRIAAANKAAATMKRRKLVRTFTTIVLFIIFIVCFVGLVMNGEKQKNGDILPEPNNDFVFTFLEDAPKDTLATLCNTPTESGLPEADVLYSDGSGEMMGIIANVDDLQIRINEYRGDHYETGEPIYYFLYDGYLAKAGDMCYLELGRAEGIPRYEIYFHSNGDYAEYPLAYDGKDGVKETEYIVKKELTAADQLSWHEITYVFEDNYEQIKPKLGKLISEEKYEMFEYDDAATYTHENGTVDLFVDGGYIYKAEFTTNDFKYPRGIEIGDSISSVVGKFPQEEGWQDRQVPYEEYDNEGNIVEGNYTMACIYGEWIHMQPWGIAHYTDGEITSVGYSDGGDTVEFFFEGGKLVKVQYRCPTT